MLKKSSIKQLNVSIVESGWRTIVQFPPGKLK